MKRTPEQQPPAARLRAASSLEDVDYPCGFYREQSPIHLNYICTLNGVTSPALDSPFRYCEIGCGPGETILMLAAANPNGYFMGIDLSLSHIHQARSLAAESGVANVEFLAADISLIDFGALPDFDFITLHGLYSWVPESVQAAIRAFLGAKLRPGGVAYVSYNALPGWGAAGALRRFFTDHIRSMEGGLLEKSNRIVEQLDRLRDLGAPFFRENPTAAGIVSRLTGSDPRYVAHEYLGDHWQPRYFADVYDEMAAQGLRYVGEGGIIENLLEHSVMPEFVEPLRHEHDRRNRETLRDFIQNRFFRRDIYIKDTPGLEERSSDELMRDTLFGLIAAPVQVPDTIHPTDAPSLRFEGAWFDRLKQLLAYRVLSLREILADERMAGCAESELMEGIKLLSAGGFCAPFTAREIVPPRASSETIRVLPKLNRIRLQSYDWSEPGFAMASPVVGSGVSLNSLEAALLDALQRSDSLDWIWKELQRRGINLIPSGGNVPVKGELQSRQALEKALEQFTNLKLPKLAYLGVVGLA